MGDFYPQRTISKTKANRWDLRVGATRVEIQIADLLYYSGYRFGHSGSAMLILGKPDLLVRMGIIITKLDFDVNFQLGGFKSGQAEWGLAT